MTLRRPRSAAFRRAMLTAGILLPLLALVRLTEVPGALGASNALTARHLNLRTGPTTTSTILMIVPSGAALTVSGDSQSGYFPVVYGERSGWVSTELVQLEMRTEPAAAANFDQAPSLPDGMATLVESLNLRSGPGTDFDAIQVVDAGTQVEATGEIDGAYEKIRIGNKEGWVRSVYVDRGPAPDLDANGNASALGARIETGEPSIAPLVKLRSDAEIVLRAGPDAKSAKLAVVPVRSELTATGQQSQGFLEVDFDGKRGWVAAEYLRLQTAPGNSPPDVPVLMYHSIQETGASYQVTAGQLEEQLAWLSANGYHSITSTDLLAWMTFGVPLPDKPVLISIDDGNASDWIFLELLEKYGFKGNFFLPDYAELTASQIRTLDRAGEVCGHTVNHPNLSTLSYDDQLYQIGENKKFLESVLGREITCFAYPFGAYSGATQFAVIESGFLLAFDVSGGPQPLDPTLDRWHILRINVSGAGTLDDFIASLAFTE